LQFEDFGDCLAWWNDRKETEQAWFVKVGDVLKYDNDGALLSVNLDLSHPNSGSPLEHMPQEEILDGILTKECEIIRLLETMLSEVE